MNTIIFKEKPVHYKTEGEGNTLVFLHGFIESLEIWEDFSRALSKKFKIVRIDLPGHGKTPLIEKIHTMELMAASVKAVLDALDIKRCVMVGHSMGGYVTLEFAKQYPQMLSGICLFHSHAAADTEEVKENRRRTIEMIKLNRKGFVKQFIPDLFAEINTVKFAEKIDMLWHRADKMSGQSIIAALEGMKERSGKLDLLLNTTIPVLFIAGKDDMRIPVQNVLAQAILPRHSEVLVLAEVGHMGFIEARDDTMEMISCFAHKQF
ncbi:MAG: alpha/beta hydrolase [Sphingobacteriia bacterium]|nr:alpha/beta hydrolase [Sphingobacteriia bacterium]